MTDRTREEAVRLAWASGYLGYKLFRYQLPVYEYFWQKIKDPECLLNVANISRRWGKGVIACLVAIEMALRLPGAQIRFAAPRKEELMKITLPIMRMLIKDAPDRYRPRWRTKEQIWQFPNGSEIHVAGVNDGHEDDLRGTAAHLCVVDEAGFVQRLKYLVNDVLLPQTLTTGGTTLLTSTPPKTPAHDFYSMAIDAMDRGDYIHRDIYSTNFSPAKIQQFKTASGGEDSTTWKREYLAQFVVDSQLAIVPEWDDKYHVATPRTELWPFYHRYAAMDIGTQHFTSIIHAYYEFPKARIVIEGERLIKGMSVTSHELAAITREQEKALGYDKGKGVYLRVADNNNPILLQDMAKFHNMPYIGTSKDELIAMVNETRLWAKSGRIAVQPDCKNVAGALKHGIWKDEKHIGRDFAVTENYGHFDSLAALIYLVRNVDQHTNPVPVDYGLDPRTQWINPALYDKASGTTAVLKQLYGGRNR